MTKILNKLQTLFATPFVSFPIHVTIHKDWKEVRNYLERIVEADINFQLLCIKVKKKWKIGHDNKLLSYLKDDEFFNINNSSRDELELLINSNEYFLSNILFDEKINELIMIIKDIIKKKKAL